MIGASSGKHLSYWIDTARRTDYPVLPGDVSADVAILGGGLVGLTAAVLLKRLGKTVAVIEARRIAELGRATGLGEAMIDEVLSLSYGDRRAFLALTLLYDRKDWGLSGFHQDHVIPRSLFTDDRLREAGVPEDRWERYKELRDRLGNLELLLPEENVEKSAKDFATWVATREEGFRNEHLIPADDSLLSLGCFEEFVSSREGLISMRLQRMFGDEMGRETEERK